MKISETAALFHVFVRSFLIQGSFSAKHRQNLGFAFAIDPVGKRLFPDPDDYRSFLGRHIENYNGNPFMVPLVLGAVAHMEERLSRNEGITPEDITRFKKIIGPATGAIGDRLFWSNMRPFSLLFGVIGALLFGLWGTLLFIGAFNIPVLFLKLRWMSAGYRLGPHVVSELKHDLIQKVEQVLEITGCILAGLNAVVLFTLYERPAMSFFEPVGFLFMGACTIFILKRGIPLYAAISWASLGAVILSMAVKFV